MTTAKLTKRQREILIACEATGHSKRYTTDARVVQNLAEKGLVTWSWATPIDWAWVSITPAGREALNPSEG